MICKIDMTCLAKPVLTRGLVLYIVQNEEFSITCCMCDMYHWQRPSTLIRDKPILSSERILHKDPDCKGSVAKKDL
jgi:hypothetical protein